MFTRADRAADRLRHLDLARALRTAERLDSSREELVDTGERSSDGHQDTVPGLTDRTGPPPRDRQVRDPLVRVASARVGQARRAACRFRGGIPRLDERSGS
ncbi:hypothetical protein GCM10027445_08710 [Amycolatopsis endophytica]